MELSQLKANPKNPRIIRDDKFRKLVASIEGFPEMMEKRPMVCVTDVDGKLFPLGGNMRLRAIQELGMKEIPDSWVTLADDWTQEKRAEFTIRDNVAHGEWSWDDLANEWDAEQLSDWGVDVPMFGGEIDDIEEVDSFKESVSFTINCESIRELEQLQTKLNTSAKKLHYKDFIIKAGL